MNLAFDTLGQEEVEEVVDILRGVARQQSRSAKHILIFQAERRRDDGLESRRTELLHQPEGGASPGTQRGNKDVGVNNDAHAREADALDSWRKANKLPADPLAEHRRTGYAKTAAADRKRRRKELGLTQGGSFA